jgi:FtsH-binding integral membrane protein
MVETMIQAFALGLAAFLALVVLAPDRSGDRSERAIKLVLMALVGVLVLVAVAVWFANGMG